MPAHELNFNVPSAKGLKGGVRRAVALGGLRVDVEGRVREGLRGGRGLSVSVFQSKHVGSGPRVPSRR